MKFTIIAAIVLVAVLGAAYFLTMEGQPAQSPERPAASDIRSLKIN